MKKKIVVLLTGIMASALLLSGCQASKGLETDNVKITQYKGVEIDEVEKVSDITDEDVDAYIQSVRESQAEITEITDRAVEEGDTVNIDFVGKIDGEAFAGGSAEEYSLTIGSGVFIDGFEDSIIGHKAGETFDWNGKFPDDYGNAEMAGKDVVFTITVNAITQEDVPELNDEFVKKVSEKSKTVDEYKKEVKELLEKDAEDAYAYSIEAAAWEKVLENTEITKYPEKKTQEMKDNWITQYKSVAEAYGMEYDEYIQEQMGVDAEEFEKQIETVVKEVLKEKMAVEAIADKEKIKLDDKTYEAELENIVQEYGYESVEILKESIDEKELKAEALKNIVKEQISKDCIQVKAK